MDEEDQQKISVSVPVGAIASAVVLGLVAVAYVIMSRQDEGGIDVTGKAKAGKGFGRKVGLKTLITLIENDATRKVLVAALKAIARRS
ncbi:MAG: hypothetical protein NVS2B16_25420 [Chloroflexota bacterium]